MVRFPDVKFKKRPRKAFISHHLFIYANPRSGSSVASEFLKIPSQDFYVKSPYIGANDNHLIEGHIFNVLDAT